MMLASLAGAGLMVSGAASAQAPAKNDYSKAETWLCRPDKAKDNYCNVDLSTVVSGRVGDDRGLQGRPRSADRLFLRLSDGQQHPACSRHDPGQRSTS
jgi:hypothetical protein